MDVEGPRVDDRLHAPHPIEQLSPSAHDPGLTGELAQERELLRPERDPLAVAEQLVGEQVELVRRCDRDPPQRRPQRSGPAGEEVEPTGQLARPDRAGERLVEAGGQRLQPLAHARRRIHEHDPELRPADALGDDPGEVGRVGGWRADHGQHWKRGEQPPAELPGVRDDLDRPAAELGWERAGRSARRQDQAQGISHMPSIARGGKRPVQVPLTLVAWLEPTRRAVLPGGAGRCVAAPRPNLSSAPRLPHSARRWQDGAVSCSLEAIGMAKSSAKRRHDEAERTFRRAWKLLDRIERRLERARAEERKRLRQFGDGTGPDAPRRAAQLEAARSEISQIEGLLTELSELISSNARASAGQTVKDMASSVAAEIRDEAAEPPQLSTPSQRRNRHHRPRRRPAADQAAGVAPVAAADDGTEPAEAGAPDADEPVAVEEPAAGGDDTSAGDVPKRRNRHHRPRRRPAEDSVGEASPVLEDAPDDGREASTAPEAVLADDVADDDVGMEAPKRRNRHHRPHRNPAPAAVTSDSAPAPSVAPAPKPESSTDETIAAIPLPPPSLGESVPPAPEPAIAEPVGESAAEPVAGEPPVSSPAERSPAPETESIGHAGTTDEDAVGSPSPAPDGGLRGSTLLPADPPVEAIGASPATAATTDGWTESHARARAVEFGAIVEFDREARGVIEADRAAAVDVGSTSVHLLVGDRSGAEVIPLLDQSELLGLGGRVASAGFLGTEARTALVEALVEYASESRRLAARTTVFVGTDPLRHAADAARACMEIERATGRPGPRPRPGRGGGAHAARLDRRRPARRPGGDRHRRR